MNSFAWLYWNPNRIAFTIPFIDHPVMWYGLFFVSGFFLGYLLIQKILSRFFADPIIASAVSDRLVWYSVIATIVGARLGHVFFYGWHYYKNHMLEIPLVWQGGLASHGGTIGLLISYYLFVKRCPESTAKKLTYLELLDRVAIPTALVGCCIRLGNFWNQELVGTVTQMPWGVVFGSSFIGSSLEPRHPVQLYEAAAYLAIFFLLLYRWRKGEDSWKKGELLGFFLVCVFSARFFLEFFKQSLTGLPSQAFGLDMGQVLSLPFIVIGMVLYQFRNKNA